MTRKWIGMKFRITFGKADRIEMRLLEILQQNKIYLMKIKRKFKLNLMDGVKDLRK